MAIYKEYPVTVTDNPAYIEATRRRLQAELAQLEAEYNLEYCEQAYGTGRSFDGLPRRKGGLPADRVAALAVAKGDGVIPEFLRPLWRRIQDKQKALAALDVRQASIEQWLLVLNEVERFAIEYHVFKQYSWAKCAELSDTQLVYAVSFDALKRNYKRAWDKWNELHPLNDNMDSFPT